MVELGGQNSVSDFTASQSAQYPALDETSVEMKMVLLVSFPLALTHIPWASWNGGFTVHWFPGTVHFTVSGVPGIVDLRGTWVPWNGGFPTRVVFHLS